MAGDLSSLLSWFANYSNFYSVLTILLCFVVMVIFILRLNNENMFLNTSPVPQLNLAVERGVTDLQNPFSVQLSTEKVSSLKDGIYLKMSFIKNCTLHVFWGIDLEVFHKALHEPWQNILGSLQRSNWLGRSTLMRDDNKGLLPCEHLDKHIKCPSELTAELLGEIPRKKYPAMVVTSIPLTDVEHSDEPQIVVMFNVIHLKDSICQLDSHIINQFLMTTSDTVPVCALQPLFVSTSPDVNTDSPQTSHSESQNSGTEPRSALSNDSQGTVQATSDTHQHNSENHVTDLPVNTQTVHGVVDALDNPQCDECIVCQSAPVTFALLPCRHACICDFCLKQMERCPMCRGYIDSYFRIKSWDCDRNLGEDISPDSVNSSTFNLNTESWWERTNRRLNEYFGFT